MPGASRQVTRRLSTSFSVYRREDGGSSFALLFLLRNEEHHTRPDVYMADNTTIRRVDVGEGSQGSIRAW